MPAPVTFDFWKLADSTLITQIEVAAIERRSVVAIETGPPRRERRSRVALHQRRPAALCRRIPQKENAGQSAGAPSGRAEEGASAGAIARERLTTNQKKTFGRKRWAAQKRWTAKKEPPGRGFCRAETVSLIRNIHTKDFLLRRFRFPRNSSLNVGRSTKDCSKCASPSTGLPKSPLASGTGSLPPFRWTERYGPARGSRAVAHSLAIFRARQAAQRKPPAPRPTGQCRRSCSRSRSQSPRRTERAKSDDPDGPPRRSISIAPRAPPTLPASDPACLQFVERGKSPKRAAI